MISIRALQSGRPASICVLLNIYDFSFTEFNGENIPSYVIASHRWTSQEVNFKDVQRKNNQHKAGYRKVMGFCFFARSRNKSISGLRTNEYGGADIVNWIWIDTCCIDKKSSAELAEAINSMFQYYQDAHECYAYLDDVQSHLSHTPTSTLAQSKWFTRGWTLQELLAPKKVLFLSSDWTCIGHKCP